MFKLWFYWILSFNIDRYEFGFEKPLNSELFDYVLDLANGGYTLAQQLVSSGAYHQPMCGYGLSQGDIAWL